MRIKKVFFVNFALIVFISAVFIVGYNFLHSKGNTTVKTPNEASLNINSAESSSLTTAQVSNPCPQGAASIGNYLPPVENMTNTTTPTPTGTVNAPCKTVYVYFSKNPDSNNDFTFTVKVTRSTNRVDVAAFSIENLIAGPTSQESSEGLFTPLKLSGVSNCSGKDFNINIDSSSKGTIKFCKDIQTSGVGDDARIKSTIEATLKQFPTITKVVILTKDDNCFGDLSGLNQCKS